MSRPIMHGLLLVLGFVVSTGCSGYDRILFATKTNIGLDIDDTPPTAEVTIARRELAITPAFEDAQGDENTLPLFASFELNGIFLDPEVTSRFAGGEAAILLAQGPAPASPAPSGSSLCLSKEPDTRPLWKKIWHSLVGRSTEDTRPFYFATDTSFGLKAAWDGSTGPYPSTLKLGYNRKELAFPPVFVTKGCSVDPATPANPGYWKVTIPSFVASLDNSSTLKELFSSGTNHVQFFATGRAASEFVRRPEVNAAMNNAMHLQTGSTSNP